MNKFLAIIALFTIFEAGFITHKVLGIVTHETPYSQYNIERIREATVPDYLPTIKVVPPTIKVIKPVIKATPVVPEKEVMCMQFNIYHESRGEPVQGQIGTGWVTINRVQHRSFGDTPCEVVYAAKHDSNGNPIRKKCQFEWYCDGKSDVPNLGNKIERKAWEDAGDLARNLVTNCVLGVDENKCPPDPTNGGLFFRSQGIALTDPYYVATATIGKHRYYAIAN